MRKEVSSTLLQDPRLTTRSHPAPVTHPPSMGSHLALGMSTLTAARSSIYTLNSGTASARSSLQFEPRSRGGGRGGGGGGGVEEGGEEGGGQGGEHNNGVVTHERVVARQHRVVTYSGHVGSRPRYASVAAAAWRHGTGGRRGGGRRQRLSCQKSEPKVSLYITNSKFY